MIRRLLSDGNVLKPVKRPEISEITEKPKKLKMAPITTRMQDIIVNHTIRNFRPIIKNNNFYIYKLLQTYLYLYKPFDHLS